MYYILDYEICALIFLLIISVRFFEVRLFPNRQNKLFGIILYCAMIDLTLDIVGSITIEYAYMVPAWVNYAINTVFYSMQFIFPAIMMIYVIIMAGQYFFQKKKLLLLLLPAVFFELVLLTNLFTKLIFFVADVDGILVYTRGPWFNTLFLASAFYLVVTAWLTLKYRWQLKKKQFSTVFCFILIIAAAMLIQFFFPSYLLTGVAITIAILLMFFTLQNPEDMLDQVSGAFNYGAMMSFLNTQIIERRPLWLVSVHIAGLRSVNSSFGMRAGDLVLAQIGAFFHSMVPHLWVFRMISTRFLIIPTKEEEYQKVISLLEQRFHTPWRIDDLEAEVMLSATVRHFDDADFFLTPEDVVNLLDVEFAEIGPDGWGSTKSIDTDLLQKIQTQIRIEEVMRQALKTGEGFSLYYQPIFSLEEKCFHSAEVLLRLYHPEWGMIPPALFIPIAEKSGLILQIDELVIRAACAFIRQNSEAQLPGLRYLEINLSAAEFFQNAYQRVHGIVQECGVPPKTLCFEVTETVATVHQKFLADFMYDMNRAGYRFALDDFGTGYANIAQVASLPFSMVKLDRTLLVANEEKNCILFEELLPMFSHMKLQTVVEGVETEEQAKRAADLRADYTQGFYYARPMPEEDFLHFLQQHAGTSRE